jgi:hypothetical protein
MKSPRLLTLAVALECLAGVAHAQTIRAVPTYHNLGLHVRFDTTPPADAAIGLAIREEGSAGDYRGIQPLSRITPTEFAGSALGLEADTGYELRLSSAAFVADRLVNVRTRSEVLPEANRGAYHVALDGNDANDGHSSGTALRTLRRALELVRAGEKILLHGGRYLEGEIEVYPGSEGEAVATPDEPIVIESAPGEQAILDGSDPEFAPSWERFEATRGVYRTPCRREPYHAYLNGGHLYHFGCLEDLRDSRWQQASGYFVDGTHLYVRLPESEPMGTNQVTIPRFTYALNLVVSHYQLRNLEFCYYGYDHDPAAIGLENSSSNRIERCTMHHTGSGIVIRHDSIHNTIQQCSFNEWPVDTFQWDAVKQGFPWGSEPYELGGVMVVGDHTEYHGNVIRSNRFERMFDGAHLFSQDPAAPTENLDFHDNLVLNCGDDGLETDGIGSNCRIYNNVFSNFLTGISVAPAALGPTYIYRNTLLNWRTVPSSESDDGRFHGYPIKLNHQMQEDPWTQWVYLYHNTCVSTEPEVDGFVFNYYWWYWTNIVARNNIFAGTRAALVNVDERCPIDFDYNNYFTTHPARFIEWYRVDFSTLASFSEATGQERHGLATEPRFAGPGDFRLRADSPLIDRGVLIPGINEGFHGAAPDLGAFESEVASEVPRLSIVWEPPIGARISWPSAAGGFVLQRNTVPAPTGWTPAAELVTDNGALKSVLISPAVGIGFYRLAQP